MEWSSASNWLLRAVHARGTGKVNQADAYDTVDGEEDFLGATSDQPVDQRPWAVKPGCCIDCGRKARAAGMPGGAAARPERSHLSAQPFF